MHITRTPRPIWAQAKRTLRQNARTHGEKQSLAELSVRLSHTHAGWVCTRAVPLDVEPDQTFVLYELPVVSEGAAVVTALVAELLHLRTAAHGPKRTAPNWC